MQLTILNRVRRTRFHRWPCSVARTVDLLGDWWTPLVLREAFYGVRRFDDFVGSLGIGRNVLAERLRRLVKEGLLDKVRYQQHPPRNEYRLTKKGLALFGVIAAMMRWGETGCFPTAHRSSSSVARHIRESDRSWLTKQPASRSTHARSTPWQVPACPNDSAVAPAPWASSANPTPN